MNTLFSLKRFFLHWPRLIFRIEINLIVLSLVLVIPADIVAQSPSPSAPAPKVFTEYDRFTDKTTVGVSVMLENYTVEIPFAQMQEFILLAAAFTHQGQRRSLRPTTIRLALQSQARAWRFSEEAELRGKIWAQGGLRFSGWIYLSPPFSSWLAVKQPSCESATRS